HGPGPISRGNPPGERAGAPRQTNPRPAPNEPKARRVGRAGPAPPRRPRGAHRARPSRPSRPRFLEKPDRGRGQAPAPDEPNAPAPNEPNALWGPDRPRGRGAGPPLGFPGKVMSRAGPTLDRGRTDTRREIQPGHGSKPGVTVSGTEPWQRVAPDRR